MGKKDLEMTEGKAVKNAKSLQQRQNDNNEKLQEELKLSIESYFSNMFKYLLVKDVLLLKVEQGVILEYFEIINIEDIKKIYEENIEDDKNIIHKSQKENIGLIDDLFNINVLTGLTEGDMRMLDGENTEGEPFELDTDRVLLVKCRLPGFNRLKLVGTLRIPKGVSDIVCDYKEKYLNA